MADLVADQIKCDKVDNPNSVQDETPTDNGEQKTEETPPEVSQKEEKDEEQVAGETNKLEKKIIRQMEVSHTPLTLDI